LYHISQIEERIAFCKYVILARQRSHIYEAGEFELISGGFLFPRKMSVTENNVATVID
jgi:hypothetical protein